MALIFQDTFSRPDGPLSGNPTPDIGPAWTVASGSPQISGGRLNLSVGGSYATAAVANPTRVDFDFDLSTGNVGDFDLRVSARGPYDGPSVTAVVSIYNGGQRILLYYGGNTYAGVQVPLASRTGTLGIAYNQDTGLVEIYVDGALSASTTFSPDQVAALASTSSVYVRGDSWGAASGYIDNVVYSDASGGAPPPVVVGVAAPLGVTTEWRMAIAVAEPEPPLAVALGHQVGTEWRMAIEVIVPEDPSQVTPRAVVTTTEWRMAISVEVPVIAPPVAAGPAGPRHHPIRRVSRRYAITE